MKRVSMLVIDDPRGLYVTFAFPVILSTKKRVLERVTEASADPRKRK